MPRTVALFVGVSNYDEQARVFSTPAHTLSAAQFRDSFYGGARLAGQTALEEQLGLPIPCCFKRHGGAVNEIAFTPDGSEVVSGSADGMVALWRADGKGEPIILKPAAGTGKAPPAGAREVAPQTAVTALAISADGSRIAAGSADGNAAVWARAGTSSPVTLAHGCAVKSVALSPNGARILTTCADGAARLWSADGKGEPKRFPVEADCTRPGEAAFSVQGDRIVIAGCAQIRVWPADGSGPGRLLSQSPAPVPSGAPPRPARLPPPQAWIGSVAFSPDGSRILAAGSKGVQLWSSVDDSNPVEIGSGAAEKAVFSQDGSRIAIAYGNGAVKLWEAGRSEPVTIEGAGSSIDAIGFSSGGEHILIRRSNGTAWMVRTAGSASPIRVVVPKYDDPKRKDEGLRSAVLSPDGKRIAVGYADGSVAVVAGEDAARLANLRIENLRLLADLRMSPLDPNAAMVVRFLQRLNGLTGLLHPHAELLKKSSSVFPEDRRPTVDPGPLNYFGDGLPVTKKRILDALSATLLKAADAAKTRDPMLLLIYVSAHGLTGPNGLPYILPADANAQDPGTWIPYDQILKPVYAFIEQEDRVPSSADRMKPTAIVILDTCQDPGGLGLGSKRPEKAADLSRAGVVVVEGTAPGQYVWHWKATNTEEGTRQVEHEVRLGFPRLPKGVPRGHFASSTSASMSILPVASQESLKRMMDAGRSRPEGISRSISAYDWLAATARSVEDLQRDIPEAQESGMTQNIQIQKQPSQPNFALFRIVGKNP